MQSSFEFGLVLFVQSQGEFTGAGPSRSASSVEFYISYSSIELLLQERSMKSFLKNLPSIVVSLLINVSLLASLYFFHLVLPAFEKELQI